MPAPFRSVANESEDLACLYKCAFKDLLLSSLRGHFGQVLHLFRALLSYRHVSGYTNQWNDRNFRKEKDMRKLGWLMVFILTMAIPNFCFGTDAQVIQAILDAKRSVQEFHDQKRKEFRQFKQQLMDSRKKELQELNDKYKAAKPEDRRNLKKEFEQKKAALKEQPKKELEEKRNQLNADLKQFIEEKKKEIRGKMKK